jgi:glycosyltransferase involved in cell wall biosynthesis
MRLSTTSDDQGTSRVPPILIAVPTYNEEPVIRDHVRRIDRALKASPMSDRAVIVNVDNRSPDGTAEAFANTRTVHPKVALSTGEGQRGKGHNLRLLFAHAASVDAEVVVVLDADLEVVPHDWLPSMCTPLLAGEADMVLPLYSRFWYDGVQTKHIIAPLALAVTDVPIRQPTGGDCAYSPAAYRAFLDATWSPEALGFGGDLHLALHALRHGLAIAQVPLSVGKIHAARSATAAEIDAEQRIKFRPMFQVLLTHLRTWRSPPNTPPPRFPDAPPLGREPATWDPRPLNDAARRAYEDAADGMWYRRLLATERRLPPKLLADDDVWSGMLTRCLWAPAVDDLDDAFWNCVQAMFLTRLAVALPRWETLTTKQIDDSVWRLAAAVRHRLESWSPGTAGRSPAGML